MSEKMSVALFGPTGQGKSTLLTCWSKRSEVHDIIEGHLTTYATLRRRESLPKKITSHDAAAKRAKSLERLTSKLTSLNYKGIKLEILSSIYFVNGRPIVATE
ncbi:7922_t:CDS:2 [Funneliformis mosseae]|uniref:7922_t:CDS:1 n=1 Tax=Funneliformis mosseae TaxID=27381 RepID=A0A9N8ZNZ2_FUNMO|nr:7922_t:CDS:2 [Funneliformis mosseae]